MKIKEEGGGGEGERRKLSVPGRLRVKIKNTQRYNVDEYVDMTYPFVNVITIEENRNTFILNILETEDNAFHGTD